MNTAQPLTAREREVLARLEAMLSMTEIAEEMCISVNTVKTHLRNVYRKLGATTRHEAVRRARQLGPIESPAAEADASIPARYSRQNDADQSDAKRVIHSAAGLLAVAARLLPTGDRDRYAEEYRSELWDLTQAGAGRIRQLQYALRQFRSTLPVVVALRSPRRRGAAL